MAPNIKFNTPSDPQYTRALWTCFDCADPQDPVGSGLIDCQAHVLVCSAHADIRAEADLSDDKQLVNYFRSVIRRRQEADAGSNGTTTDDDDDDYAQE